MRLFGIYAPIALVAVQMVRWIDGSNPLTIAVEFAALLQIIRVATRRGAAHDQQLIALSLLQLIAATVLGGGLAFALCFIGFVLITPSALVLSHLRREVEGNYRQGARDRTGLPVDVPRILRSRRVISRGFVLFVSFLSLPVFVVTAIIFISFPRVGLSLLLLEPHRPSRMVGFSDRVDLGGVGALQSDPAIAMRVTYPQLPEEPPRRIAVYLRGTALDRYEGTSWSRTRTIRRNLDNIGTQYAIARFPDPVRDSSLTIDLEPIDPPVLFVPEETVAVELLPHANQMLVAPPIIFQGEESELRYSRLDDRRGPKYRVYLQANSHSVVRTLTDEDRHRYLQLPTTFGDNLRNLSKSWAAGETEPSTVAERILARLRNDYRYDLNSPSGKAQNPLEHFLLVSKRGHCEFYSTAMALILRSLNVPTRNVTGFAGATYNKYGKFYVVRQGDAHSWVEVWLEGSGWKRFDPTPVVPAVAQTKYERWAAAARDLVEATSQRWNRHVERYDLRQQLELFGGIRDKVGRATHWANPRPLERSRLILWVVALFVTSLAAYVWWRYRQRRGPLQITPEASARSLEIIQLYQQLEQAMEQRGVGRPMGTPPLAHATALHSLGHPQAQEILELTTGYLEVRFGGRPLSKDDSREFRRRVLALRRRPAQDWTRSSHSETANDDGVSRRDTGT
jgi:transglutaminase-like putative cysteine protease